MCERPDWHEAWPEVPEGHEIVAIPDPAWRVQGGMICRFTIGPGQRRCRKPTTAELNRALRASKLPRWWAYCEDHLYGRWIEDGKVMHWIMRKKDPEHV